MLQRIHERISGWVSGLVIIIAAGALIFFGMQQYMEKSDANGETLATVNGEKISQAVVNDSYTAMLREMTQRMGGKSLDDSMKQQLKAMALQSVITNVALSTTLSKEGFLVGLPQIKMMVAQMPEFQQNGQFSRDRFMSILASASLSPVQFFQRMQTQFVVNQAMNGVAESAFMLPYNIDHIYSLMKQQRSFGYLLVHTDKLADSVNVTSEEMERFYSQHKDQFQIPAKVQVEYLQLSPGAIENSINISTDDVKSYYESNINNYQIPAHWQVRQYKISLPDNASEKDVKAAEKNATQVASDWKSSGKAPADSTEVTLSSFEIGEQLRNTLQKLKTNEISQPLRTSNGFSLLQIVNFTPKKTREFSEVEKNILSMLKRQKANQIFSEKSSKLADITYTNPDSLVPAAKELGLPVEKSDLISRSGDSKGIFSNQKVLAAIFDDNVFKDGNNSNPISLPDGTQLVVRISKKVPSKQLPFKEVADKVKALLVANKDKAQAGVLAYSLQSKLASGESPLNLIKNKALSWTKIGLHAQDDAALKNIAPEIINSVFTTQVNAFNSKNNKPIGVNTVLLPDGNYAVIAIDEAKNGNIKAASEKDLKQLSEKFSSLWGDLLQRSFVNSVVASSKIEKK